MVLFVCSELHNGENAMSDENNYDEMEDINEEDMDDPEKSEKIAQAYLSFTDKFAEYVRQIDIDLFRRAVDYAKTFTEEDIPGISLTYHIPEEDEEPKNEN